MKDTAELVSRLDELYFHILEEETKRFGGLCAVDIEIRMLTGDELRNCLMYIPVKKERPVDPKRPAYDLAFHGRKPWAKKY